MSGWFSRLVVRWTDLAIIGVVVSSLVTTLVSRHLNGPDAVLLLILALVYIGLGTVGYNNFVINHNPRLFIYYPLQFGVISALCYVSQVSAALSIVALAAQSAWVSWRQAIVMSGLLLAMVTLISQLYYNDWGNSLSNFFSLGSALVFVFIFTQVLGRAERATMENERLAIELREANRKLREYSVQVEELATTKERNRVAREIHDSLGHYFTVVNVQIEAARTVMRSDPDRSRDALLKAQTLSKEGLAEVRRSIATLRVSPLENQTLVEALHRLVEDNRSAGIVTELNLVGEVPSLSAPQALTLFRVAQEGLTNIRKHACASRAELRLDFSNPARVDMTIEDNGVGMSKAGGGGFGLVGIRERVQLLNGSVEVKNSLGQGFRVKVELPV